MGDVVSGRDATVEVVWRAVRFHVCARLDDAGRVYRLGDVTLPWDRAGGSRALHEMTGAIIQADRYFRTPGPDGSQLISIEELVQILKPYGASAFATLMGVLARLEREEVQAVTERRSAAFLSRMEDV